MKDLKMIPCRVCKQDMPELRKIKFGYDFCIQCSNIKPKQGMSIQLGEGDHTYTETIIVNSINSTDDNWDRLIEEEDKDKNLYGPMTIINPEGEK